MKVRHRTIREALDLGLPDPIIGKWKPKNFAAATITDSVKSDDVELAVRNGVPRSTARDWSRLASPKVITLDVASMSDDELSVS